MRKRKKRSPRSVILLSGQSNMCGRGSVDKSQLYSNSEILVWRENSDKEGCWEVAKHPLHYDHSPSNLGVGPGLAFASHLAEKGTIQLPIGLVPCGQGGSSLGTDWNPLSENGSGRLFMETCNRVRRALQRCSKGVAAVDVILCMQGETEARNEQIPYSWVAYQLNLTLIALINCLGSETTRTIVSELPSFMKNNPELPGVSEVNRGIRKAIENIPNGMVVAAENLESIGDSLHLCSSSAETLGKNMAHIFEKSIATSS